MNFSELKTELTSRGAENDATRNGRWINQAYREIINAYDWPFTETSTTGTAGAGFVSVPSLRKVIVVGDILGASGTPGRRLSKATFAELSEDMEIENIGDTGSPEFWWYDAVAGQIKSYPLGGTIYARYHQRINELTGTDTPIFDEEYHLLIAERAMVEVYKDLHDYEEAAAVRQEYLYGLALMAKDHQVYSRESSYIQATNPYDG